MATVSNEIREQRRKGFFRRNLPHRTLTEMGIELDIFLLPEDDLIPEVPDMVLSYLPSFESFWIHREKDGVIGLDLRLPELSRLHVVRHELRSVMTYINANRYSDTTADEIRDVLEDSQFKPAERKAHFARRAQYFEKLAAWAGTQPDLYCANDIESFTLRATLFKTQSKKRK